MACLIKILTATIHTTITATVSLTYHNLQSCACALNLHHMTSCLTVQHTFIWFAVMCSSLLEEEQIILYKYNIHVYPLPQ